MRFKGKYGDHGGIVTLQDVMNLLLLKKFLFMESPRQLVELKNLLKYLPIINTNYQLGPSIIIFVSMARIK